MKIPLASLLVETARNIRADWEWYQQLKNFRCAVCDEYMIKVPFLQFEILKKFRKSSNLILEFDKKISEVKVFHLECKLATQIKDFSFYAEADKVDKP